MKIEVAFTFQPKSKVHSAGGFSAFDQHTTKKIFSLLPLFTPHVQKFSSDHHAPGQSYKMVVDVNVRYTTGVEGDFLIMYHKNRRSPEVIKFVDSG